MWHNMKNYFLVFFALISLLLAAGCGKEESEPKVHVPVKIQHTLTYSTMGNGSVEGNTSQTVVHGGNGTPVTAVPAENYHFVGWSDGEKTPTRTDTDVMDDLTVTAEFAVDQYSLTYMAGQNGTIDGVGSQLVDHGGTSTAVTAVPADGYHFVSWSDGVEKALRTDSEVTTDLAVTATFALNRYTLRYEAVDNGAIKGEKLQTVDHGRNGSTVTAVPNRYHHFIGWSDGVTTPGRTDPNVTTDLTVTAKFAIDQYALVYSAGDHGTIQGSRSQKVDHGSSGSTVTAVPAEGYHFVSWSDGVSSAARTDRKVTSDLAVTAEFAINRYSLTYTAAEHGFIEGASPQTVNHGDSGSPVTAVAERGFHFTTWNDGLTTDRRVDSGITGDLTVRAEFAVNTYSVGGNLSGLVEGTQVILQNNDGDDLVLSADGDFSFATELLNVSPYDVTVATQPTSPNQVCTVKNATGIISEDDVADIAVTCVLMTYTIGGTISGIPEGDRVVLQNNDGDDLTVDSDGPFVFATPLDDGSSYQVTVAQYPKKPNWTCDLEHASRTLAGQDVTDVFVDCYPKVVVQAATGIRKVKLNWNTQDFDKVTFNLCRAREEIPVGAFEDCQKLRDGVAQKKIDSPLVVSPLTNDIPYWFQVEAQYDSGRRTLSEVVKAIPYGGLNDSGIDWCADSFSNYRTDGTRSDKEKSCGKLAADFPGQDGLHGRDAAARVRNLDKTGSGAAGFDFTKFCRSGEAAGEKKCAPNPLPGADYDDWACTHDNVTGLTWEIKPDQGLRSKDKTYNWYVPDDKVNGGGPGQQGDGNCEDDGCDTYDYIRAVKDMMLCGYSDWRLPTRRELLSIVDNGRTKPAVDPRYFPNTQSDNYWTSTPYQDQKTSAWQVHFLYGEAVPGMKTERKKVRLVRGETITFGLNNP